MKNLLTLGIFTCCTCERNANKSSLPIKKLNISLLEYVGYRHQDLLIGDDSGTDVTRGDAPKNGLLMREWIYKKQNSVHK